MICGIQKKPLGNCGMINNFFKLKKFWKNKKVFLTGHTGFKGAWFCIFLNLLGAKVIGYSLRPEKRLNLFDLAKVNNLINRSIIGDIRDYDKLKKSISKLINQSLKDKIQIEAEEGNYFKKRGKLPL